MDSDLVVVGVVGKPFGVRGACYVRPAPDVAHDFAPGCTYAVTGSPGAAETPQQLEVVGRLDHGNRTVLSFAAVDTREAAEQLRGTVLALARSAVALPDESLWAEDVLGAPVVDPAGTTIGEVTALADGPAHDYLVVTRPGGAQVMVPAVAELVTVEMPADDDPSGATRARVVVQPVPGLLEPGDAVVAAGDDAPSDTVGPG